MSSVFLVVGVIFVAIAALIHVAIFALESLLWSRPATWKRFGLGSQEHADIVRPMAYNQGFYNVFLALGASAGIAMIASANLKAEGVALSIFVLLSMLLASIVLITSNPRLARAAVTQGATPLVGLIFLVLSVTSF